MNRLIAVVAALAVLGCGSESDTSQPGGGGAGTGGSTHAAGYAVSGCSFSCYPGANAQGGGKTSNGSCTSGTAERQRCGGFKREVIGGTTMSCWEERWVCR